MTLTNVYDPQYNRGPADYDITHTLSSSWVYEIPWAREKLYGGWQWWTLARPAVEYLWEAVASDDRLVQWFRGTIAPCEAMVPTVLVNSGRFDLHPDSRRFVAAVLEMLGVRKLKVGNVDVTLLAQTPKVSPYRLEIRRSIAQMLGVTENQVNIKATTTEHLGFIGRSEGLAAQAVVLLESA